MVELAVDRTACVGAGQCVLVAPDVFDQDDDGLVIVLDDSPDDELAAQARRAASLCPARAILWKEPLSHDGR
jgi:ferredoxin